MIAGAVVVLIRCNKKLKQLRAQATPWTAKNLGQQKRCFERAAAMLELHSQQEDPTSRKTPYWAFVALLLQKESCESAAALLADMYRLGQPGSLSAYTATMGELARKGRADDAFALFEQMQLAGIKPSVRTLSTLLSACRQQAIQEARRLKQTRALQQTSEQEQEQEQEQRAAQDGSRDDGDNMVHGDGSGHGHGTLMECARTAIAQLRIAHNAEYRFHRQQRKFHRQHADANRPPWSRRRDRKAWSEADRYHPGKRVRLVGGRAGGKNAVASLPPAMIVDLKTKVQRVIEVGLVGVGGEELALDPDSVSGLMDEGLLTEAISLLGIELGGLSEAVDLVSAIPTTRRSRTLCTKNIPQQDASVFARLTQ